MVLEQMNIMLKNSHQMNIMLKNSKQSLGISQDLGVRGPLDSMGMTLAKIPNNGEMNLKRSPPVDKTGLPVNGWTHPSTFKIFDPELYLYQYMCNCVYGQCRPKIVLDSLD